MRQNAKGFTLIELLIVIAIIGILAAVLIPNLLNARKRAFDTAAQTCLKDIATNEEIIASNDPWEYSNGQFAGTYNDLGEVEITVSDGQGGTTTETLTISSCKNMVVANDGSSTTTFGYKASHPQGANTYRVQQSQGVVFDAEGTL